MNKLSDEELENVNGRFGADPSALVEKIANQIINLDYQIQTSSTKQPTQEQRRQLQILKLKLNNAKMSIISQSNVSKTVAVQFAKAWGILSKYNI